MKPRAQTVTIELVSNLTNKELQNFIKDVLVAKLKGEFASETSLSVRSVRAQVVQQPKRDPIGRIGDSHPGRR